MNKKVKIFIVSAAIFTALILLSPMPLFNSPLSTVVEANDGSLLGARIADDGQWRFPGLKNIPDKFEKSLLIFEDRYFYYHPGINALSILRALVSNILSGHIVSGGSTVTMQVARLSAGNYRRTYLNKLIEVFSALKLEIFRSKKAILLMYAANAPFGGNIVGLEAASWRYTGKPAADITWAEAATLSILPNSPGLVYPGRNQDLLKLKRDKLLNRLHKRGYIDSLTLILSVEEPLPGVPGPLPSKAPHLTDYFFLKNKGAITRTTIEPVIQERASQIINDHQKILSENYIFNSACIIVEVGTGNVLAYVGNSTNESATPHGGSVDIIRSSRSTGSILKPFLYAAMQQSGDILPNTIIPDIPTRFPGFSPKNFDNTFNGAVPAGSALSQSLNVPAVKMLQKYNPEKFLSFIHKTGFTTFNKPADYYGLSIILGGGETSLWELTGAYSSLSRVLNNYLTEKKYYTDDYHPPVLVNTDSSSGKSENLDPPLTASSIWLTYEALQKVNRPVSEAGWQYFSSSTGLAWKTGTSFGFRDAWAVGTTPQYVIGVWAGNGSGEGRPGLTGLSAAAPILFDLAGIMPQGDWFDTPFEDLTYINTCKTSGFRAGPDCPETIEIPASINGLRSESCIYHQLIHLDKSGEHQVTSDCYPGEKILNVPWFVLPPAMEYFYKRKHPEYKSLPPVAAGCSSDKGIQTMEFIYPTPSVKIFIPRDQSGSLTRIIPEIAHRIPSRRIFWHLDEMYIGTTRNIHQIELLAEAGNHVLTAVDEDGNMIKCLFLVIGKN